VTRAFCTLASSHTGTHQTDTAPPVWLFYVPSFVLGLFNKAPNSCDQCPAVGRLMNELSWMRKEANAVTLRPDICLKQPRKTAKNISHDSWYPRRDVNQEPPEYKKKAIITARWQSSVSVCTYTDRQTDRQTQRVVKSRLHTQRHLCC
jgi:hypothetical protein